jgi:ribosome biogenesis SPOUT family RNA methylase Rps3
LPWLSSSRESLLIDRRADKLNAEDNSMPNVLVVGGINTDLLVRSRALEAEVIVTDR